MTGKPVACVIGDMDLVRPLGLAGIPVVAAGPTGTETRWSRYTSGGISLPDLWSQQTAVIDELIRFAVTEDEPPILFYQKDPAVLAISRFRSRLEPHFRFLVPEAELVEDLVDKARFRSRAEALGLPIPTTTIVTAGDHLEAIGELRFPVIVKPAVRDNWEHGWFRIAGRSAKAFDVRTESELATLLGRADLAGTSLVVQELIDGPEREIWSYHNFTDDHGVVRGEFAGRKIRTKPARYGQSTAVEIVDDPDVIDLGRRVLAAFEFTGVAKVDLKRDADGNLHLLEVNPRFSLWNHPGAIAGVNLPAQVYHYLTGQTPTPEVAMPGTTWCQIWGDRGAAAEAGVGLGQWMRFAVGADSRRAGHLTDPGSMAGALYHGISKRRSTNRA